MGLKGTSRLKGRKHKAYFKICPSHSIFKSLIKKNVSGRSQNPPWSFCNEGCLPFFGPGSRAFPTSRKGQVFLISHGFFLDGRRHCCPTSVIYFSRCRSCQNRLQDSQQHKWTLPTLILLETRHPASFPCLISLRCTTGYCRQKPLSLTVSW